MEDYIRYGHGLILLFDLLSGCREYVVDLVGEPGRTYYPDSSINGALDWSINSPFQLSNRKAYKEFFIDNGTSVQASNLGQCDAQFVNPKNSGVVSLEY